MGFRSLLNGFQEFCETSTFHGLPLIVAKKRHFLERIFWLLMFLFAIGGAVRLCLMNWDRFIASPTVVSLQKDYRNWYNPFPAATGCFLERVDEELAQEYIKTKWGINEENEKYEYYMDFIKAVANVSYFTMDNFTQFQNDKTLDKIDMLDLALKVHPPIEGDLVTFDAKRKIVWDMISTEFGLCYTSNSKSIPLFSAEKLDNKSIYNSNNLLKCHYLNGMCYARFDSEPSIPVNYFIHSPYEVIHTTATPPLHLPAKSEKEVNYQMQETAPAASVRRLSISQRQCRFYDEPISKDIPAYSMSICNILCRYRHALKKCGCRPFFYNRLSGKICNITGMVCLSKHTNFFTQSAAKMSCNCVEPCRVITYTQQSAKSNVWVGGYFDQRVTLRWALLHPRTRYQRDVLFGFEDLVVSFGGTASLCFGMSFLSIIEVIFFIIKKIIQSVLSLFCKTNLKDTSKNILNDKKSIKIKVNSATDKSNLNYKNNFIHIIGFNDGNNYSNNIIKNRHMGFNDHRNINAGIPFRN